MSEDPVTVPHPEPEDLAAFLQEVEIFQDMTRVSAERVAGETQRRRFSAGTKIISRGEAGDCMFLIVEGTVQIPVFDEDGRERFVAQLGPRQIFGEMALLTGETRSADVIAIHDTECLVLSRVAVEEFVQRHTEVAQFLTAIVGERLVKSGAIRRVGKYNLVGELGRGGMSIVYEGFHPGLERSVAIKMLAHEMVYRPQFRERFENEAKIIGRLQHPHIVEVYDAEQAYATYFIVMERLHGRPLDEVIRDEGRLDPGCVRRLLCELASALSFAHEQGIVHRDVKPSNIFVTLDGSVKLMDFGLALDSRMVDGVEEAGTAAGTPMYMAPEQVFGTQVDHRADIYALGLVAFEMLVGAPPFTGRLFEILRHQQSTPVPSVRAELVHDGIDVPEELEEMVRRATAKAPKDRFQSCDEILDLLGSSRGSQRFSLEEAKVHTMTLVYRSSAQAIVDEIAESVRQRIAKESDIVLR